MPCNGSATRLTGFSSSAPPTNRAYDSWMSRVDSTLTAAMRLEDALAALKRAASERHALAKATPEYARALETEMSLTHTVYELASEIQGDGRRRAARREP